MFQIENDDSVRDGLRMMGFALTASIRVEARIDHRVDRLGRARKLRAS